MLGISENKAAMSLPMSGGWQVCNDIMRTLVKLSISKAPELVFIYGIHLVNQNGY